MSSFGAVSSWVADRVGPALRWEVVPGAELADQQVTQMFELRHSIMRLRDASADRLVFEQRVRMAQRNLLLRNGQGELVGMFSMYWRDAPDGRSVWLMPEYACLRSDCRGSPSYMAMLGWEFLRVQVLAGGRPLWFAGVGYPRSFQTVARVFPEYWTFFDDDRPTDAEVLLKHLHSDFFDAGWDRENHWVTMPTIPEPGRTDRQPSEAWAQFERRLPHWEQGVAIGVVFRVPKRTTLRVMRDSLQRAWRLRVGG